MRRLEAATPLSMAEIQADKDQLRAEFAMSTRRLEMSVEQLKTRSTSQLAELGKKGDAINRLKIELGEKTATIFALEARDKALRDQLRATEEEVAVKTSAMHDAQRALVRQAGRTCQVDGRTRRAIDPRGFAEDRDHCAQDPGRGAERTAGQRRQRVEGRRRPPRRRARRAESRDAGTCHEERGKVENLGRRVAELEQQLAAQTTEAEMLGRRAHDLESRSASSRGCSTQSEFELKQLRSEIESARKVEGDLRTAIAEIDGRSSSATESLKAEKAQLQAELAARQRRARPLRRDLGAMKRETEETWASERVENALLRERINDVAAEVARLASALEGPNSPIDALLAAETRANGRSAASTVGADVDLARRQQRQSRRPHPRAAVVMPRGCRRATSRRDATEKACDRPSLDTSPRHSLYRASADWPGA